jgi:hypothetical protein
MYLQAGPLGVEQVHGFWQKVKCPNFTLSGLLVSHITSQVLSVPSDMTFHWQLSASCSRLDFFTTCQ